MAKFKAGQKVICVDAKDYYSNFLELGKKYVVSTVEGDLISVNSRSMVWLAERFEDFDTWASHQVSVKDTLTGREEKLVQALRDILELRDFQQDTLFEAQREARNALEELGL